LTRKRASFSDRTPSSCRYRVCRQDDGVPKIFEIYAAFGIKEFWLYDTQVLRMFELSETGEYLLIEKSIALPVLIDKVLTEFLNRSQSEDQFEVLLDFEKWLQENK